MSSSEDIANFREFKLDINLDKAYSFCLIGSTRSGKSTFLNHLIEKYLKTKINILMTQSPNAPAFKDEGFKKNCILAPDYMPNIIHECYKINKATNNKYGFNFILDDLVGFRSDKEMKKLLCIYRNSNIGVCITGQSKSILDNTGRSNINFVFLGYLNNDEETENVIKAFLKSFFPSDMKMVDKIKEYRRMTSKYHWIVLDNINGESFITKIKI